MAKRKRKPRRPRAPRPPRPQFPAGWLTAYQVAEHYGVTHSDVCHHLRRGTLPGLKFATVWMVKEADLPAELPPPGPVPGEE